MKRIYLFIAAIFSLFTSPAVMQGVIPTLEVITPENASRIEELRTWGKGLASHIAISPDGRILAVANTLGLWLYDIANADAEPRFIQGNSEWITEAVFADNETLITLEGNSSNYTMNVWELATEESRVIFEQRADIASFVTVATERGLVAVVNRSSEVELWNIETGALQGTLGGNTGFINRPVFNADGNLLAVPTTENIITIWDVAANQPETVIQSQEEPQVGNVVFSMDGNTLLALAAKPFVDISSLTESEVQFWDISRGNLLGTHLTIDFRAESILAIPNSQNFVAIGTGLDDDGAQTSVIQVRDVTTGDERFTLRLRQDRLRDFVVHPEGTLLIGVTEDGSVRYWNAETGEEASGPQHVAAVSATYTPDGQTLAIGYNDGSVQLIDSTSFTIQAVLEDNSLGAELRFSPDGALLLRSAWGGRLWLWDVPHHELIQAYEGAGWRAFAVVDANLTAFASQQPDNSIQVFDLKSGRELAHIPASYDTPSMALSPGGSLLAITDEADHIQMWDVAEHTLLFTLTLENFIPTGLDFSDDGQTFSVVWRTFAQTIASTFQWVDSTTGQTLNSMTVDGMYFRIVRDSPNQLVVIAENGVTAWNPATGEIIGRLESATGGPRVTFHPTENLLAVGSGTSVNVQLWSPGSNIEPIRIWTGGGGIAQEFSPDGKQLVTVASLGIVRLWGVPANE